MRELSIGYVVAYAIAGILYVGFTVGTMFALYYYRENPMVKIRNLLLVEIQLFFSAVTLASTTFTNFPMSISCSIYVITFVSAMASLSALVVRCFLLTLAFNVSMDSVALVFGSKRANAGSKQRSNSGLRSLSVTDKSAAESPQVSRGSKDSMLSSSGSSDESTLKHQERIKRLKRNRFLFKRSSIICIWFSITLLCSFVFMTNYFASSEIRTHLGGVVDDNKCGLNAVALSPLFLASFIMLGGIAYLITGFRKIQENFKLKEELYRLAIVMILNILLLGTGQALSALLSANHPVSVICRLLWYAIDAYQTYSILDPIVPEIRKRSQRSKRRASQATSVISTPQAAETLTNRLSNFKFIMSKPDTRKKFIQFLVKEFSSENIFFYEAVLDYNASLETRSVEDVKKDAMKIFETYCMENSPLCVNLSYVCRQRVIAKCKVLEDKDLRSLFTEPLQEIVDLVLKDSFPRYLRANPLETNPSIPDTSAREEEKDVLYSMHDLELVQAVSKSSA